MTTSVLAPTAQTELHHARSVAAIDCNKAIDTVEPSSVDGALREPGNTGATDTDAHKGFAANN